MKHRTVYSAYTLLLMALAVQGSLLVSAPLGAAEVGIDAANVVYVTDELRLGLYPTEETNGRSIRTLVSGARLEVLERALMSIRIRTDEGDEGWVKTAYIVTRPPARRQLQELTELQERTATELSARAATVASQTAEIASLSAELAELKQGVESLPEVLAENAELRTELEARGRVVPVSWLLVATLLALAAGIGVGYWWLDRRVRSKFGGIRVY